MRKTASGFGLPASGLVMLMTAANLVGAPLVAQQFPRAAWNEPQKPFKVFGNTYWVGTHGLGSLLITSDAGHVLIDGALPESVPQITGSIRTLGFKVEDVKLIVNSHVHFDHAGGISELQRLSGARVAASASTATALMAGKLAARDAGTADAFIDPGACKRYVAAGRQNLAARVAKEAKP